MTTSKTHAKKSTKTSHASHASHASDTTTTNPEITAMSTKTKTTKPTTTTTTTTDQTPSPITNPTTTVSPTTSPSASLGLASLVAHLSAALDAAEVSLGPAPPVSTTADKRRTGKPRKGADKILTQLAPVVKQFGLDSTSLNTEAMLARHETAQTLAPLQARLQKIGKRVDDEVFGAQTDAWDMGLQFYSLLRRRAKTDGNVETALGPLVKAFSYRHPSTRAGKDTKVETRLKARLKETLALAEKHGVKVTLGPSGLPVALTGPAQAVQAAQADLAGSTSPAPVAAVPASPAPAPVATSAPAAPAPIPASAPNGASAPTVSHS